VAITVLLVSGVPDFSTTSAQTVADDVSSTTPVTIEDPRIAIYGRKIVDLKKQVASVRRMALQMQKEKDEAVLQAKWAQNALDAQSVRFGASLDKMVALNFKRKGEVEGWSHLTLVHPMGYYGNYLGYLIFGSLIIVIVWSWLGMGTAAADEKTTQITHTDDIDRLLAKNVELSDRVAEYAASSLAAGDRINELEAQLDQKEGIEGRPNLVQAVTQLSERVKLMTPGKGVVYYKHGSEVFSFLVIGAGRKTDNSDYFLLVKSPFDTIERPSSPMRYYLEQDEPERSKVLVEHLTKLLPKVTPVLANGAVLAAR
jgi:hypothetical protein